MHAEWVTVQALKKPYPGAPLPPVIMGWKGFNVGSSGQDSQARIPQFFNFVGSSDADAQAVRKTSVNASVPPSVPMTYPNMQSEPGYYISPFDGEKRMREDNLTFVEQQRAEWNKIKQQSAEWSRSMDKYSGTTISPSEEARIREEVRTVMK